ncbi:hypothetical protein C1646_767609 [Rhizophagus diaphanus]|nr:hypothetical protein C1646_767609 [Rhizophagus diaphanus] [Rhizophagus sp. MUCL 43196]
MLNNDLLVMHNLRNVRNVKKWTDEFLENRLKSCVNCNRNMHLSLTKKWIEILRTLCIIKNMIVIKSKEILEMNLESLNKLYVHFFAKALCH